MAQWAKEIHGKCGRRGLSGHSGPDNGSTSSTASTYPEIAANAALTLIAVATALLDRQIAAQAKSFETEGGFTERLYRTRSANRRGR
jgi:four helix bundle suffix protein